MANLEATLLASAARTATTSAIVQTNGENRGIILFLDVTVGAAAETLTLQVQMLDPVTAKWTDITAFPASAAAFTGIKTFVVYPGAVETTVLANHEVAGIPLPTRWRATITHSAAGSWTYSLGVAVII